MPTLYVENVPDELYDALRQRAKSEGRSISAEVMKLLAQQVPTPSELARRKKVFKIAGQIRWGQRGRATQTESAEEILRADRRR